jgi:hypothetical protein
MDLPRTLYVIFNGSPAAVASSVERMNSLIATLSSRGTVTQKEPPAHFGDNYRVRLIPEVSELLV